MLVRLLREKRKGLKFNVTLKVRLRKETDGRDDIKGTIYREPPIG